jgi:hypothetical protein
MNNLFPLALLAGAAYAGRAVGRRAFDEYTGEPLPPGKKAGRPRVFWHNRLDPKQPSDTKRAKSLWNAFSKAHDTVLAEHLFSPRQARDVAGQAFDNYNATRGQMRVCDGTLRLADNVKPGALYKPQHVVCDGTVKPFTKYQAEQSAKYRKRAEARLLTLLGRDPTKEEIERFRKTGSL